MVPRQMMIQIHKSFLSKSLIDLIELKFVAP